MKLAVLGAGSIGTRHTRNAIELGHEVIAYDPDDESRAKAARYGATIAGSRKDALSLACAAIIASPSGQHHQDLDACIDAGCHVFLEKPMATSDRGLSQILARGRAQGLQVFVAQNLRVHPAIRYARKVLQTQQLGIPLWASLVASSFLPAWRPGSDHRQNYAANPSTGGAIFDYVHELDLAWHLLGPYEVLACTARSTGTIGIVAEDTADIIVQHENHVHSNIHIDYVSRPAERITTLVGTLGRLQIDIPRRAAILMDVQGDIVANPSFGGEHGDDYVTELEAFVESLSGTPSPLLCDAQEGLLVLREVLHARALAGLPRDA